jgi:hypothetical protein
MTYNRKINDPAMSGKREMHYTAVVTPQSYQGVGWALARAYPAAGETIPPEFMTLLRKLDGDARDR